MSSMLSPGELIGMQAVLNRTLPGTATISRLSTAPDGQGGGSATWTAVGTTACRLSPLSQTRGSEPLVGSSVRGQRERMITLPASTDVTEKDRIVIASVTYEVIAMDGPRSMEISRRVTAVKV